MHPANRGRGVAERLVEEACRIEESNGVKTFEPDVGLSIVVSHIGKLHT